MRKPLFLFAPATLALVSLIACENDSTGGAPGPTFDSGLAEWNPPPGTTNDGGTVPDASPDAPAVPSVSVTVFGLAGPKAGVRIVFHDANGAVMETKLTGNNGKATRTGATPAMASALLGKDGHERRIVTWTGVEDGDDLQVRDEETDEQIGLYNVTFASVPDAAADIFIVENACDRNESYGTATSLPLYRSCTRAQNAVLATARPFQGNVSAYAFKKGNAAVTDGGMGAITLGDWKTPTPFTVNVTNMPGESWFDASLLEIADGSGFTNVRADYEGSTVTYPVAPGFADAYQASVAFQEDARAERRLAKRVAPAGGAANVTFDYNTVLPVIDDASVITTNPRRPTVNWTTTAPLTGADGGVVHILFSGPMDITYSWTFVVPASATTVTAPAMPAEAAEFLPLEPDSGVEPYFSPPRLLFVEGDAIPSYASFRRQQGLLLDYRTAFNGNALPALPANGTYRTTSWNENPR